LPLLQQKTSFYGIPLSELTSTANAHSCRFDLIARDPAAAGRAFFEHLERDLSWDMIRITDVPDGGAAWQLADCAKAKGCPVGAWTSLDSPYVPLAPSWEEQASTLQAKFKANCRRRRKKLEERGRVTFV